MRMTLVCTAALALLPPLAGTRTGKLEDATMPGQNPVS